jgi:dCTP deaminase
MNFENRFAIGIDPFDPSQVQPASIDLTLSNEFLSYPDFPAIVSPSPVTTELPALMEKSPYTHAGVIEQDSSQTIDLKTAKEVPTLSWEADIYFLRPNELILASTEEYVSIPPDIVARVEGKSSLGRLGLLIHITAGFIDPGFCGKITLEIKNLNNRPIAIRAGYPICQLSFSQTTSPCEFPYGHEKLNSKYQDQRSVTASRYNPTYE